MAEGRFRADLEARLSGFTLRLPPLRERRMDLGILIRGMLQAGTVRAGVDGLQLTGYAARALMLYDFPKNNRELESALVYAVMQSEGKMVERTHLPESIRAGTRTPPPGEAEERAQHEKLLEKHGGVVAKAAREAGVHVTILRRTLKRLGIDLGSFRDRKQGSGSGRKPKGD